MQKSKKKTTLIDKEVSEPDEDKAQPWELSHKEFKITMNKPGIMVYAYNAGTQKDH